MTLRAASSPGLTILNGKTLTVNNSLTLAGTDGTTITFQATDTYVGRATTDTLTNKALNTFSGALTFNPANLSATFSPTGAGTVTINPATAGTIDNMAIGNTTPSTGKFSPNGLTVGTNQLVVSGGNIGIGVTPTQKVHAFGTGDTRISVDSGDTTIGAFTGFQLTGGGVFKGGIFLPNNDKTRVALFDNSTEVVSIKNGLVGIINTNPARTLDVTGTFGATGAATLGSTLAVTGATTLSGSVLTTAPTTQTGATYTVAAGDFQVVLNNAAGVTVTLPAPGSFSGRHLILRTIAAGAVISASSNVVPLAGGVAGTAILAATAGKFAWLHSDGTNWQISLAN